MQLYAREGFSFLFMIEKATGEMVGHCGIKRVDNPLANNPGDHEIGWLVREDRWRRGYAEEAMRAVLDWAFARVGAPHVVALTSEANVGSWKLMEKLGMVRRADLDFDDPAYPPEDRTTILYSLSSEQWEKAAMTASRPGVTHHSNPRQYPADPRQRLRRAGLHDHRQCRDRGGQFGLVQLRAARRCQPDRRSAQRTNVQDGSVLPLRPRAAR